MTSAIATLVTTLGDFPLDPQAGLGWLWSADGRRLLWASPKALQTFDLASTDDVDGFSHQDTLRSMVADLALPAPDQEPVRVQQVSLISRSHRETFMCLARAIPLVGGHFGILAVAVGAPARSLEEIRAAILIQQPTAPEAAEREILQETAGEQSSSEATIEAITNLPPGSLQNTIGNSSAEPPLELPRGLAIEPVQGVQHVDERAILPVTVPEPEDIAVDPVIVPVAERAAEGSPAWVGQDASTLRPRRFVWQTDGQGRFVHLSRELSEAVGISKAMLMGQTWQQAAKQHDLAETEDIDRGFASLETWTARAVLWPVAGTRLGIPVEMAGMPVRDADRFAGFRGYGIARIERAVRRPGSAEDALANDEEPTVERDEDRFGPAVARALAARSVEPVSNTPQVETGSTPPAVPPARRAETPLRRPLSMAGTSDPGGLPAVLALQKFIDETHRTPPIAAPDLGMADRQITPLSQPEPASDETAGQPVPAVSGLDAAKSLSEQERRAFRDIAKALGAARNALDLPASQPADAIPVAKSGLANLQDAASDTTRQRPMPSLSLVPFGAASNGEGSGLLNQSQHFLPTRQTANRPETANLLEKLPIGLLVMQKGRAAYANRSLLSMLGYADFDGFVASGGAERLFGNSDASGRLAGRSFALQDANGRPFMVDAAIHAIDWDGGPATLTSFLPSGPIAYAENRDTIELDMLAARAELRELQFVLDTATDGIISLNSEGRILGLNRSAEALFGFDQNEIAGESITTLLAPESHVAALDYLDGLKINGVASIMNDGRDIIGRERHGGSIPLFMTLGRLGDDAKAQRFCAVLRDVTAWKKAEADLQEAKRLAENSDANKSDFLARISHEVRTPLNAILGFSQVMMAESLGPIGNTRYVQYAKDIHASGQHVLSLVNDLLDLSKINSGKLDLTFGSVDVKVIVAECVAMIQPQATAGKIIVRSQLSNRLPPIVADDRSLRQILLNLLSNAIKFTEPGGQVIVSATFNDQCEVILRVRDTGIGMDDTELQNAMEPFRQVAGPRASGGTGLGLPLTKALVEANRATFSLTSERNKGTLAEVVFPSARVLAE